MPLYPSLRVNINVRDYGATGDGSTDDTTAINAAIAVYNAQSPRKGARLYFPKPSASYKVTAGLTSITAAGIIEGDGIEGTKIVCTSATAVLFTIAASGVTVRDLWLHNSATASNGAAVRVTTGNINRYVNLLITSFYTGLDIQAGIGWVATGCYIESVKKYGIQVSGSDADWNITDCLISDAAATSADAAIRIESTGDGGGGKISGLKVNGTPATGYNYGIDLAVQATTSTVDLQVTNCSIENTRSNPFHGTTASGGVYGQIIISGNEFGYNVAGNAISLVATNVGEFYNVLIGPNSYESSAASPVIQLTKVDRARVMGGVYKGSWTSFLSTSGCTLLVDDTAAIPAVTAMPASPATNDRVYRTDLKLEFAYDGTRWLTVNLYHLVTTLDGGTATSGYAGPSATTSDVILAATPALSGGSDIWLDTLTTQFFISGGTALSGSHLWTGVLAKRIANNTGTTLITVTVNSGSSSVWRTDAQSIGALMNNGTTHYVFGWTATKTGTPGPFYALFDLTYRIVAT